LLRYLLGVFFCLFYSIGGFSFFDGALCTTCSRLMIGTPFCGSRFLSCGAGKNFSRPSLGGSLIYLISWSL
jgi:hypothetical protein